MKKKILGAVTAIAIAVTVAFNLNVNADTNELSALTMGNIEALASGESGEGVWVVTIYSLDHWKCDKGGKVCCPDYDC